MTALYQLTKSSLILRTNDRALFPQTLDNPDFLAYQAWIQAGNVPDPIPAPPPLSAADLQEAIKAAIQLQLDTTAQAHAYDNIISACSYAAQPLGAPFQAEGAAFLTWRSAVWSQAYALLAQVQSGEAQLPTAAEAVAMMPPFVEPT